MKKIGIILNNLGLNQTAFFAISNINKIITEGTEDDFVVFYENLGTHCIRPLTATTQMTELFSFNGTVIATSISQANSILQAVSIKDKYLYLQDVEWCRPHSGSYKFNLDVLRDKRLKIIVRSTLHEKAVINYCNRYPVGCVEDFHIDQLYKVLNNEIK